MRNPVLSEKSVTVIGCGVSGLTCGIRFLEEGYNVRIVASSLPPDTTSNVAAAYWYPYKVSPQDKVLGWASYSYKKFLELSALPETGVTIFEFLKIFDHVVEEPFWKEAVRSFRNARPDELPEGYVSGFVAELPLIETPVYMRYLVNRFRESGGTIEELGKDLSEISEVSGESGLIVNCSGLGSRELCNDEKSFPIRGQLVRTTNPGLSKGLNDEIGPLAVSYIVPRSSDCILGGTAEENNWSLDLDPNTSEEILRKCSILQPRLSDAEVLEYKVGLRPGRTEVRLEHQDVPGVGHVIHNYGHGGAGFTLSWGCAEEVLELAKGI